MERELTALGRPRARYFLAFAVFMMIALIAIDRVGDSALGLSTMRLFGVDISSRAAADYSIDARPQRLAPIQLFSIATPVARYD